MPNRKLSLKEFFIKNSLFFVYFLILSCSTVESKKEHFHTFLTERKEFQKISSLMGDKKYKKAIVLFKQLLQRTKDVDIKIASYYNIASSYKSLNNCSQASVYLKKILKNSKAPLPILAKTYLGLAEVYSCLRKDILMIKSLKMTLIKKFEKYFDFKVRNLKTPAMIAGGYGRLQNFEKHKYYFLASQRQWVELSANRDKTPEDHKLESMIFYYAGDSKLREYRTKVNLKNIIPLLSQQMYLIHATCLRGDSWSLKSYDALKDNYAYLKDRLKRNKKLKKSMLNHLQSAKAFVKNCKIKYKIENLKLLILNYRKQIQKI